MTRSIRGRLLLLAAVWLTAALLGAFLLIAQLLEDFVTDRFDAETLAIADSLIGQLEVDDGRVELDDTPLDVRFTLPLSGWYWQVMAGDATVARSPSLLDGQLTGPAGDLTGATGRDADAAGLRVLRR